jgi:hypothetical protein
VRSAIVSAASRKMRSWLSVFLRCTSSCRPVVVLISAEWYDVMTIFKEMRSGKSQVATL